FTFDGRYHRADNAVNHPPALQEPRPPVFVGGKGDRLIQVAVEHADGWNTCWVWTPDAYRERLALLEPSSPKAGPDPPTLAPPRPRAPVRRDARPPARRCRSRNPRRMERRPARGHRRRGARPTGGMGRARRRDARRRGRPVAVLGHHARRRGAARPRAPFLLSTVSWAADGLRPAGKG